MIQEPIVQLIPIFQKVFSDPSLTIDLQTRKKDILGWDSLTQLQLIVAIEADLKVRFLTKELFAFNSVAELVDILESKKL